MLISGFLAALMAVAIFALVTPAAQKFTQRDIEAARIVRKLSRREIDPLTIVATATTIGAWGGVAFLPFDS